MKKFYIMLMTIIFILPCFMILTACGEQKETRVMTISINPEIEFVLDKEDKVVSVNALNDEGNYIIANAKFNNLSADDAVNMFLNVSKEKGYLVASAEVGENEITISISGDADKLYEKIKSSANDYLKSANISLDFKFEQISKEAIAETISECMQEYNIDDLKEMTEAKLIEMLQNSRKETSEFMSQELKQLYYDLRLNNIRETKFKKLKTIIQNNTMIPTVSKNLLIQNIDNILQHINEFKNNYEDNFLSLTSDYQVKMREFVEAKQELLHARLDGASDTILSAKENAVNLALVALESSKTTADSVLQLINNSINSIIATIETTLESLQVIIGDVNSEINSAVDTAKNSFRQKFESEYQEFKSNNNWESKKA